MISASSNDAHRLLQPLKDSLIQLLECLVRTDTVAVPPVGSENAGQAILQEFLERHGLQPELYEVAPLLGKCSHPYARRDRQYAGRKNLQLLLSGSGGGKSLLLNGHMDTVPPVASQWTREPWSPHTNAGKLYGLGSFDMKGGLVAQFGVACALHKAGLRLAGDLLCESVVDEEWGGGGGTLAARLKGSGWDAAVIGEGTQHAVYRATRGGAVIDLSVQAGDAANYFSSNEVVSPALHLGRLLQWVETWVTRRAENMPTGAYRHFADPTPLQVLAVESNRMAANIPFSVPQKAAVRLYFQFLPNEDVPGILSAIQDSLNEFAKADLFFRQHPITWKPFYDPPLLGHELAEHHPWTACLTRCVSASLGMPAVVTAAPYPCDAFLLQREFKIPTLLYGPCGAGAHNPDEYVEVDSVLKSAEVLLATALEWCNS